MKASPGYQHKQSKKWHYTSSDIQWLMMFYKSAAALTINIFWLSQYNLSCHNQSFAHNHIQQI